MSGTYQLLATSPLHNAASDGTDVGVNINLLSPEAGLTSTCPSKPNVSSIATNTSATITWCARSVDNIQQALVYGLPTSPISILPVLNGSPYGDGTAQYHGDLVGQPTGTYTIQLTNLTGSTPPLTESSKSLPITLFVGQSVTIPPPRPVTNVQVQ